MSKSQLGGERQKFFFEFITSPTADINGTCLVLHFDKQRYLFGQVSEGTQRACIERGISIKKVRNIFLTGKTTWLDMGGLIGMLLTLADVQAEERDPDTGKRPAMSIHGGPKLMHALACARRFVFRTAMPLRVHEASLQDKRPLWEPSYQDANISVWSIPVQRRSGDKTPVLKAGRSGSLDTVEREQALRDKTVLDMFDSDWRRDRLFEMRFSDVKLPAVVWTRNPETKDLTQTRCTTMEDAPHLFPDSIVLIRNPWPAAMLEELPPADNLSGSTVMSYIVCGQPQRGRFLPQKAKELGVKPGPLFALLAAGQSVTLDDGKVIASEMVLEPTQPGHGMAVLDVPSEDYLDDISEKLGQLVKKDVMAGIKVITWLLGPGVYHSSKFQGLAASLDGFRQVVSSKDTTADYLVFDSSAASSARLAQIRPDCFLKPINNRDGKSAVDDVDNSSNLKPAIRGLRIDISPTLKFDESDVPEFFNEAKSIGSYASDLKDLIPMPSEDQENLPFKDVEITTLGTGSAVPSKYRNVSGTLVRIPELGYHLFDCGENTLGQLRRLYTAEELDNVLCDLRMIWISHLHADHHLGTLSVIAARNEAVQRRNLIGTGPKLYLVSEPNMCDFLVDYSSIEALNDCVLLSIDNSKLSLKRKPISLKDTTLPIHKLQTVRVAHCHHAQAISVTFSNGFKFSFSGDCRPSAKFAQIGQDSDVLVHEATFDDGMEGDAMAKKHCTTGEALGVAAAMKAKNVILTHFSQRYQKIPLLNEIKFADQIKFEEGDDADVMGAEEEPPVETTSTLTEEGILPPPSSTPNGSNSSTTENSALIKVAKTMSVCAAFDFMRVKISQIPSMYKYYPAIEKMFDIEAARSEERRLERAKALGQKPRDIAGREGQTVYSRINRGKARPLKSSENSPTRRPTKVIKGTDS